MSQVIVLLIFLTFAAKFYTFNAQVKQCEYVTTIHTGASRGPRYKLGAQIVMSGDGSQGQVINTTNLVKRWGDMGKGYRYFWPNTRDKFRTTAPCTNSSVCFFMLFGKKGELKPKWFINNITVTTKVREIARDRVFELSGEYATIEWKPRETNTVADCLAKEAAKQVSTLGSDQQASYRIRVNDITMSNYKHINVWTRSPPIINVLLLYDQTGGLYQRSYI